MWRPSDWFRNRKTLGGDATKAAEQEVSLEETKAVARQYLEQAGYYEGKAPHVVLDGKSAPPIANPAVSDSSRAAVPPEPSDDGDADVALAAGLRAALKSAKASESAPGFAGGESGGGGASDSWDSPAPE